MPKPVNPYPKGTLIWAVMEGDWEDLTVTQIAEVLYAVPGSIYNAIRKIKKDTGYDVPRSRAHPGRKPEE